jgi:hypothetical protein
VRSDLEAVGKQGKCRWIDGWEQRRDANRSFPPDKSLNAQICKLLHLGSGNFYISDEKISDISNLETVNILEDLEKISKFLNLKGC